MGARRSTRLKGNRMHQESAQCTIAENGVEAPNSAFDQENTAPQEDISVFEQTRLETIRKNAERLAELTALASGLTASHPAKSAHAPSKGIKKVKSTKKVSVLPTSRRTRARGLDEQSERYAAGLSSQHGGLVLADPANHSTGDGRGDADAPGASSPEPQSPVGVGRAATSENLSENDTFRFLHELSLMPCQGSQGSSGQVDAAHMSVNSLDLDKWCLSEGNVMKVVKEAVIEMSFMPTAASDKCVIAACDKRGQVGIWHTDPWNPDAVSGIGEDGVFLMRPHRSYVSALCWVDDAKLITAAYDGTVRMLDVASTSCIVLRRDDVDGFSTMAPHEANTLLLASDAGNISVMDRRVSLAPKALQPLPLHDKCINTIHCTPPGASTGHSVVTSSSDSLVKVWDMRALRPTTKNSALLQPVADLAHTRSCHGAYFDDTGDRIVSTAYDNTVRIWHQAGSKWEQTTIWKHNNQTGRWIVPFRARWGPGGQSIVCGDMGRGICTWNSIEQAAPSHLLRSEWMTAIPSRLAVDNTRGLLAAATASGRIHLWTAPCVNENRDGVKSETGRSTQSCSVQ
eukprot:jgi/Ulvmu1/7908/UM004_0140.1